MPLRNVRIIVRIGLVVGAVFLAMLVLMAVEMKYLGTIKHRLDNIVLHNGEKLALAQDLHYLAGNGAVIVRNLLLTRDAETIAAELDRLAENESRYRDALQRLEALETEAKGRQLLAAVTADGAATRELWRQVVALGQADNRDQAVTTLMNSARSRHRQWLDSLAAMVELHRKTAAAAADGVRQEYNRARMVLMAAIGLLLLVSSLLVAYLASGIVRPLQEFIRTIDSVAGGDLTTRITSRRRDEIGTLGDHLNRMVEQLQASEQELEQYRFHLEELIAERTGALSEQRKRFTSMLIHDLKGPLVPIIGFSRKLAGPKAIERDKVAEYARAIQDAAMKLAVTIDQVSADLRCDRLQPSYDSAVFDVVGLLESVVKSFRPKAEIEHIDLGLESRGREGEGAMIFTGDSARIQTLIENLVGNAMKYARSRVGILLTREGGDLVLVVEDDGIGIEEQYRQRIFEEYFQAPHSKEGSGVGLYSVKQIVEHYQGEIAVDTAAGGGARFTVRLPVTRR